MAGSAVAAAALPGATQTGGCADRDLALRHAAVPAAVASAAPPVPTVSAPPPDPYVSAEQAALTAYRGMWQAYAKAGATANPDDADLARYADGAALKTLRDGLASLRRKHQVLKGQYRSNPHPADAPPSAPLSTVVVEDCLDDSEFLTYTANGQLADSQPGGRRATRATVTLAGPGQWKVSSFGVQTVGTC